jgi:hypothetical protein
LIVRCGLVAAVVGCAPAGTSAARPEQAPAPVRTAPELTASQTSQSQPQASQPEPAEAREPATVLGEPPCALFAALFEKGRTFEYRYTDTVDTHATPGDGPPIARTSETIACKVTEVAFDDAGLRAELECKAPTDATIVLDLDGFRYRDEKLFWSAFGDPNDEPWLACEPRAHKRSLPDPPDAPGSKCTVEVAADAKLGWCRIHRCPKGGYGFKPSMHRTCFTPAGLSLQAGTNLEGPRQTTWELLPARAPTP